MSGIVVVVLVGLGIVLLLVGRWGRANATSIGHVPGMPADMLEHRITVLRRGATTCAGVGVVFVLLGILSPLLL
jgi:hypothetical protein